MASLTIRKLDDSVKAKLRIRAAENGRSMEEEARTLLEGALQSTPSAKPRSLYASIRQSLAEAGIDGMELEIPPRGPDREPPDFSGPEYGFNDNE
jgi:plasmid stability protein